MRLGYACINQTLRDKGVAFSKGCKAKTVLIKGVEELKSMALQNIADIITVLVWNEEHNIRLFRITSNLFPHMGNQIFGKKINSDPYFTGDISFASAALKKVGAYAKKHKHRLTFHMTPYIQFGSTDKKIVERSLFDVGMYKKTIDMMGISDSVIILHGGGVYQGSNTKEEAKILTLKRWISTYKRLPKSTPVAIENDERHYSVMDLLPLCEKYGIPLCLDLFHNSISADKVRITNQLLVRIMKTWKKQRPKFHISEQWVGKVFGAHAPMVRTIPNIIRSLDIDIMIEAKNKEIAVLALMKTYKGTISL
jgi:UV DNA damage endonuclease